MKETDLAAEVNYAVLKMAGQKGIRYTYCDPPQITSGPERTAIADTMSNHATERRLCQGDLSCWNLVSRGRLLGGHHPKPRGRRAHRRPLQDSSGCREGQQAAIVPMSRPECRGRAMPSGVGRHAPEGSERHNSFLGHGGLCFTRIGRF